MLVLPHNLKVTTTDEVTSSNPTQTLIKIVNNAHHLLEQMNQIIFIKDTLFRYIDCNRKLVDFSRLNNKKRIIDQEDYNLPWAEDTEFYRKMDKDVLSGQEMKILMSVRVASGEKISAIQNKKAIIDPHTGEAIGIVACMTEIQDATINEFLHNIKARDAQNISGAGRIPLNYPIQQPNKYNFTTREFECLFYTLRGMTCKMIADILKISPRTVEKFIWGIKNKMGCTYKTELIEKSIKDGLIDLIPPSINIKGVNAYMK